jgi:hypothetical protein
MVEKYNEFKLIINKPTKPAPIFFEGLYSHGLQNSKSLRYNIPILLFLRQRLKPYPVCHPAKDMQIRLWVHFIKNSIVYIVISNFKTIQGCFY